MQFKLETKEKFHVICPDGPDLSASLTEEMSNQLIPLLGKDVKNVVLNLKNVATSDPGATAILARLHEQFYANAASFVICCLEKNVVETLSKDEIYYDLNIVPTESEAWDIVQMEEMERDLYGGEGE